MRISDWSSDVCSSDLIIFLLMTGYGFNARAEPATPSRVGSFTLHAADRNMLFGDPFILHEAGVYYMYGTSADDGIEVFRSEESRVGRVCQYVYISVLAVSLKKKMYKNGR